MDLLASPHIDVKPHSMLLGYVGDGVDRIEGSGHCRAGRGIHEEGSLAIRLVTLH